LKAFVEQEFAQIKHVLHGISLLGQCPDSVNAALICRGEKLSIAIMAGLLEARGHKVSVINPVEKLLPWATIWNPPSISPNPPAALPPARSRQTI
jgi:aspartokinase/homoserine dehydrogenase 1